MRRALFVSLLVHGAVTGVVALAAGSWLRDLRGGVHGARWLVLEPGNARHGDGRQESASRARRGLAPSIPALPAAPAAKPGGHGASDEAGDVDSDGGGSAGTGEATSGLELASTAAPEYPSLSRRLREEGEVVVEVSVVTTTGEVRAVRLIKSSGHQRLDQAAQRYLREARYRLPAVPAASRERVYTRVFTLRYSLSEAGSGLAAASPERR